MFGLPAVVKGCWLVGPLSTLGKAVVLTETDTETSATVLGRPKWSRTVVFAVLPGHAVKKKAKHNINRAVLTSL